jgi:3-hydroxyisobutyrate dehydrogenase
MSYIGMFQIGFIGLGAMGSRMATSLLRAGHRLTIYNRSVGAADALLAHGAQLAGTPREAAQNADFVVSMVRDDDASRAIWTDAADGALAGMRADAVAIDSSTLTPAWVRALEAQCKARGIAFLEAPVAGSRPQAEAGQLVYFVGGDADTAQRADIVLKAMGSAVHYAGAAGHAAAVKLMVNAMFGIQLAGLAELLGMARQSGVDTARLLEIFAATPVASPAAKLAGAAMLTGNFAPLFPIELADKDFSYVAQMAGAANAQVPLVQCVQQVLQRAMKADLANSNITAMASLYA